MTVGLTGGSGGAVVGSTLGVGSGVVVGRGPMVVGTGSVVGVGVGSAAVVETTGTAGTASRPPSGRTWARPKPPATRAKAAKAATAVRWRLTARPRWITWASAVTGVDGHEFASEFVGIDGGHDRLLVAWAASPRERSLASAREQVDLTVPAETPSWAAISASLRSS